MSGLCSNGDTELKVTQHSGYTNKDSYKILADSPLRISILYIGVQLCPGQLDPIIILNK